MQNRLWTADRLEKRGFPNCGLCPLCKQTTESITHLLVNCRFIIRLWGLVKDWLGLHALHPTQWTGLTIKTWWSRMAEAQSQTAKPWLLSPCSPLGKFGTSEMTGSSETSTPPFVILDRIKREGYLWVILGDKCLGEIMPEE
uniref:Uncharacterized protein n=1 Tax=Avena sativa TaxID=4498 RepID=A0ACD5VFQ1_AVESA